jgi:hypothetical protein
MSKQAIRLSQTAGTLSSRALEKLFAEIDRDVAAANARKRLVSFDSGGRIGEFLSKLAPRKLALSAVAAVLAIVVQAAVITAVVVKERDGHFWTASALSQGTFVAVRFAPRASVADITAFLDSYKLSLVDGPRPGNLYKLRIANATLTEDELATFVRLMERENVITFAAAAQ